MSDAHFWSRLLDYSWGSGSPYVLAMALVLAFLLVRFRPADRGTVATTLGLFVVGLAGQFLSGVLDLLSFTRTAGTLLEVFVLLAGVAVIRLWGLLVFRLVLPRLGLTPPRILEDIVVMLGYVAWGLVRMRYAGLDLSGILATSALITAILAFSMQDTLGNILGGIALQLDDSLHIGDWVKVDEVIGRVVDIRWRFTAVETRNWETVIIPNSQLMKSKFTVLGRRQTEPVQWRRWVWFHVDLDTAPSRVIQTVERTLRRATIAGMANRPAPNCQLMDFETGCGRYAVRYWLTDLAVDDPTDSEVREHVYTALRRAGIRIAAPHYNLHTTKEGEKRTKALEEREIRARLAALASVDLFSELTEEERKHVAERLVYAPFASGDVITQQGATAHWLYLLIAGEAEVYLEIPSQDRHLVTTLTGGSVFGEMGLLTGAPRATTVIARTDTECYRLDKAGFADILQSRPALAEAIARILATRQQALEDTRRSLAAERLPPEAPRSSEILDRIQRFFGLLE